MASISRDEAHAIIKDIMINYGGIDDETRVKFHEDALKSIRSLRGIVGHTTSILANDLYSKDTRFVFELIQNAEDNSYTISRNEGTRPFIKFTVSPEKIVVDSNEDGFGEADVRAICSVGDSTKETSTGYIGEKGIGFKSVFKVASRVVIQSGPFCFYFDNEATDDGLGMITPYNAVHQVLPSNVRTRIALTLKDSTDYLRRVKEIEQIPPTLPLFLHNIEEIAVEFAGSQRTGGMLYEYDYDETERIGHLRVTPTLSSGERVTITKTYHVVKRTASGLPHNEARKLTNRADIILAFPVNEAGVPEIAQQDVFAFLPIRQEGFTFIIQSDFILQANREGLLQNEWNEALLDQVAQAFRDAILRFCTNDILVTTWMRWLPKRILSEFWAPLKGKITALLKKERILHSWSKHDRRRPTDLRYLPSDYRDQYGEPLLRDLTEELYLSQDYGNADWMRLRPLGCKCISIDEVVERIDADLQRPDSYVKSKETSEDWHTRFAALVCRIIDSAEEDIRKLHIIPVQSGQWVSADSGPVYYPCSNHCDVPTDLGLRLIDPSALNNSSRSDLYAKLGAQHTKPASVVDLIIKKYNRAVVDLQSSISHLRYLYYYLPRDTEQLDKRVYMFDRDESPIYRARVLYGSDFRGKDVTVRDLYFETTDEYGLSALYDTQKPRFYRVRFLHPAYIDAVSTNKRVYDRSWRKWLHAVAEVRYAPRLVRSSDPTRLSSIFQAIIQKLPDKLIAVLYTNWNEYKDLMRVEIVEAISNALVQCEGGLVEHPLEKCYIPKKSLKNICDDLSLDFVPIHFLALPEAFLRDDCDQMKFLERFGVGYKPTLEFYFDILSECTKYDDSPSQISVSSVSRIYKSILRLNDSDDYERTRDFFNMNASIYVSDSTGGCMSWAKPSQCCWRAPGFIDVCHQLALGSLYGSSKKLEIFFTDILEIEDATMQVYLDQLLHWSTDCIAEHVDLSIYRHLVESDIGDQSWEDVRDLFEEHSLIYLPERNEWYPPSACLWVDITGIPGTAAIRSQYHQEYDLFVERLGVRKPDVELYVKELKVLCDKHMKDPATPIRDIMKALDACKPSASELSELMKLSFLPVNVDGIIRLKKPGDVFAIMNRREHQAMFHKSVPNLDFDIEEVHSLRFLLEALGLNKNYSSEIIVEETSVEQSSWSAMLTDRFRERAYAFFRCAAHYGNDGPYSKDDSLYSRLLHTRIYKSMSITSTVSLCLNGSTIASKNTTGRFHLDERQSHFKLYVPSRERDREICFFTEVPKTLASLFAIVNVAAEKMISDIWGASPLVIDALLDANGIVNVTGVSAPVQAVSSASKTEFDDVPLDRESRNAYSASSVSEREDSGDISDIGEASNDEDPDPDDDTALEEASGRSERSSVGSTTLADISVASARAHMTATEPSVSPVARELSGYKALLDHVICAGKLMELPPKSHQALSPRQESGTEAGNLASEKVFGIRDLNPFAHDSKIGAAGELLVYELLLQQGLPDFDLENWKSKIRHHVSIHDKYQDVTPWYGTETADFVYDDVSGELTEILISLGYLDSTTWGGKFPRYYIEVKSTRETCGTRFYMSKAQYKRMSKAVLVEGQPASEIYVIFRVFKLDKDEIGVRIFVDPKTMEENGELEFQVDTYTVLQN